MEYTILKLKVALFTTLKMTKRTAKPNLQKTPQNSIYIHRTTNCKTNYQYESHLTTYTLTAQLSMTESLPKFTNTKIIKYRM